MNQQQLKRLEELRDMKSSGAVLSKVEQNHLSYLEAQERLHIARNHKDQRRLLV